MVLDNQELITVVNNIRNRYNIVGDIIYFSDLNKKNGEQQIFQNLNLNRKEEFLSNDIILIIQDCNDEYSYEALPDTPGDHLAFVQQCLEKIDITNCFVTIVTSNPDIHSEIQSVNKEYSDIDDTLINFITISGNYEKKISKQDTFCIFPWKEVLLQTDADITPCCMYTRPNNLGNLKSENITEILHGKKIKNLRKNMLNGVKSIGCESCYSKEKHGVESRRQYYNKNSSFKKSDAARITKPDGDIDDSDLFFDAIELALDSTCNFKCRCCSGDSSTLIAIEEEKLFGSTHNKDKILNNDQKDTIVNNLNKWVFNKTNVIKFSGGEPTLHKGHYEILDTLIANRKEKTIHIKYALNGSNLHYKNKSILDYWKLFDNVDVVVSVDGFKETFEYLRHGADWENTKNNLQQIKNECPHVKLMINSVISFISIESTILLQKKWHEQGIIQGDLFNISLIQGHNGSYDIQVLPIHHKKRLSLLIDKHCEWLDKENQCHLARQWREVKKYMLFENKQHKLNQAKRDIELLDSFRNENFYDTFPELSDIFDNILETKY